MDGKWSWRRRCKSQPDRIHPLLQRAPTSRALDGKTPDAAHFVALASAIRDAAQGIRKERGGFVDDALARSGPLAVEKSGDFPTASLRPHAPPIAIRFG